MGRYYHGQIALAGHTQSPKTDLAEVNIRKEKLLERQYVKMSLRTEGMIGTGLPGKNLCPQNWCQSEHLNEFWHRLLCGN